MANYTYTPNMPTTSQYRNYTRPLFQNNFLALGTMVDPNTGLLTLPFLQQQITDMALNTWYFSNRNPNISNDGFSRTPGRLFLQKKTSTGVKSYPIDVSAAAIDKNFGSNSIRSIYGYYFTAGGLLVKFGSCDPLKDPGQPIQTVFAGSQQTVPGSAKLIVNWNKFPTANQIPVFKTIYNIQLTSWTNNTAGNKVINSAGVNSFDVTGFNANFEYDPTGPTGPYVFTFYEAIGEANGGSI